MRPENQALPPHTLDLPELITVTQDQVHVLVKGFEGPDEDAAVLQDAPHPVVNVLQHLAALAHRFRVQPRRPTQPNIKIREARSRALCWQTLSSSLPLPPLLDSGFGP